MGLFFLVLSWFCTNKLLSLKNEWKGPLVSLEGHALSALWPSLTFLSSFCFAFVCWPLDSQVSQSHSALPPTLNIRSTRESNLELRVRIHALGTAPCPEDMVILLQSTLVCFREADRSIWKTSQRVVCWKEIILQSLPRGAFRAISLIFAALLWKRQ